MQQTSSQERERRTLGVSATSCTVNGQPPEPRDPRSRQTNNCTIRDSHSRVSTRASVSRITAMRSPSIFASGRTSRLPSLSVSDLAMGMSHLASRPDERITSGYMSQHLIEELRVARHNGVDIESTYQFREANQYFRWNLLWAAGCLLALFPLWLPFIGQQSCAISYRATIVVQALALLPSDVARLACHR